VKTSAAGLTPVNRANTDLMPVRAATNLLESASLAKRDARASSSADSELLPAEVGASNSIRKTWISLDDSRGTPQGVSQSTDHAGTDSARRCE
jgi:hypothetical protein